MALTAKGQPLSAAQSSVAARLILIGRNLNAPTIAIEACIFDAIMESDLGVTTAWNPTYGGVLGGAQATFGKYGPPSSTNVLDAEAREFYSGGSGYNAGGAIAASATYSDLAVLGAAVTSPFDANDPPPYGQYIRESVGGLTGIAAIQKVKAEAIAIVLAERAGGLAGASLTGTSPNAIQASLWTVGDASNPDQDYWTTINQYCQNAQWYCFSDGETLFVADGYKLMAQQPVALINRLDSNIITAVCTYDNSAFSRTVTHVEKGAVQRKAALAKMPGPTEVELQIICDIDRFRGGDTVYLTAFGPTDGIWLVGEVERSIFQPFSTLTLVQGMQPLNASTGLALGNQYLTGPAASRAGSGTVIARMISEASTINNANYPYVWGGGHAQAGTPSVGQVGGGTGANGTNVGFDCSGAVAAVLAAGGLWPFGTQVLNDADVIQQLNSNGALQPGQGSGTPECTIFDKPGTHIYMRLDGKYWGTLAGTLPSNGSGVGWCNNGYPMAGFTPYHVPAAVLGQVAAGVASSSSGAY